jgi:folate-binding protein YgfZ
VTSAAGPLWVVRARALGADGAWVFGEAAATEPLRAALLRAGVGELDTEAAEALRILAGEPKFGVEITSEYFPMEVGLNEAIDYGKGCFLGQEPIVRIRDRGHINWRLVGLRLRDDGAVAAGDRLEATTKPKAGRVTSVARLPGEPAVALALLHVSVPVGSEVIVRHDEGAETRAEVVGIPPEGADTAAAGA